MSEVYDADAWTHYMNCGALVIVENLAELLNCSESEVEREVRRLLRWWP